MPRNVKTEQTTIAPASLDEKDLAILKLLQHNARITVKEISQEIHLQR